MGTVTRRPAERHELRGQGRTEAPFCYQTLDALAALREAFSGRELTTALAIYVGLTELANEKRHAGGRSGFKAEQKDVAAYSGASVRTISDYAPRLVAAGVLELEDDPGGAYGWRLCEPGTSAAAAGGSEAASEGPAAVAGGGRQQPQGPIDTSQQTGQKEKNPPGPPADEFPAEMPVELTDVAIAAGKVLKRAALARGQGLEVTRRAVGHAVLTYPDRDHLKRALDLENWLTNTPRGRRAPCKDVVQRWRHFLDDSDPMPRTPAGMPITSAQPSASSATLREMAADLRSQGS